MGQKHDADVAPFDPEADEAILASVAPLLEETMPIFRSESTHRFGAAMPAPVGCSTGRWCWLAPVRHGSVYLGEQQP